MRMAQLHYHKLRNASTTMPCLPACLLLVVAEGEGRCKS